MAGSFAAALLQTCAFAAMLTVLGLIVWDECALTDWEHALVIIAFVVSAAMISALSGLLGCFTCMCRVFPEMPKAKLVLTMFYSTMLLATITIVNGRCGSRPHYVPVAAASYFLLTLAAGWQLWHLFSESAV